MKTYSRNSPAASRPLSKAGSSRNSSRNSSRYTSPARQFSPSRYMSPSHSITFPELASRAISDLLKVRAQKISKTIEIVAKEFHLHKKIKSLLSDELKSKKSTTQQFSMKKVDERVAYIMKESASELLELENKCNTISDQNESLKTILESGKKAVSLSDNIEKISEKIEEITLKRDAFYYRKIEKTAERLADKWKEHGWNKVAAGLAWNIIQENKLFLKQNQENTEILQYEKGIRKNLEAKLKLAEKGISKTEY